MPTKAELNFKKVQKHLTALATTEPLAAQAAELLDKMLGLQKDKSMPFKVEEYLTGEPLHDAAVLRAFSIDAAANSGVSLAEIIKYAYEAAAIVLKVVNAGAAIFMLF